jgi:L-amino acid N-acyltransferase YncA
MPMIDGYEIARATKDDIAGIMELQEPNLPDHGGMLSVRFPAAWFETAIAAMPVIVARREGRVVGYLVSSSMAANAGVPIVQTMLRSYRGAADAYIQGPICVDDVERGRGLAAAMFAELRALLPGREGITFVRRDNAASLRAHAKMGMREVTEFTHGGVLFVALSHDG